MQEVVQKDLKIESMIYKIRGKYVMLDSDLGKLYKCSQGTKAINQAVKRNMDRFPDDFCFQLTKSEYNILKSQIVTSRLIEHGGVRKFPYVFTEEGVAMLSSCLHTKIAKIVSVDIMRAFVAMKKYISSNLIEQKYINTLVLEDHDRIKHLEESFVSFESKRKSHEIYYNGQIFDAYYKILEIFKQSKEKLVIIDSYADASVLDMIKKLKAEVTIITKRNGLLSVQDIDKYNKQYNNLKVIRNDQFHDRYFILDDSVVYHCGASINRIGYKTFSITLIGDEYISKTLINKVSKIK